MKNLVFILMLFCMVSCKSQTIIHAVQDAKKLEINKKEFIGKPLSHLLKHINPTIKSVIPIPNKNKSEINRIYLLFIPISEFRKLHQEEIINKPIQIRVTFNQNFEDIDERCKIQTNPKCFDWTKEDEQNLGDLMVYDIYVTGKN